MAFSVTEFDGLALPAFKERVDSDALGTGNSVSGLSPMPGGEFYDSYASTDRAPAELDPIIKEGWLFESSAVNLRAALDALRAKKGKRGQLKATWHDGTIRWLYARLMAIEHPARRGMLNNSFVRMEFEPESDIWLANTITSYSGTVTAASGGTQDVIVANAGNIDVIDLSVTITAGAANNVTSLTVENVTTGQSIVLGAVSGGVTLLVDVGAKSITKAGADAYSAATPSDKAAWLTLQPGNNTIRFTVGGNAGSPKATYAISYYAHYA